MSDAPRSKTLLLTSCGIALTMTVARPLPLFGCSLLLDLLALGLNLRTLDVQGCQSLDKGRCTHVLA